MTWRMFILSPKGFLCGFVFIFNSVTPIFYVACSKRADIDFMINDRTTKVFCYVAAFQ